VVAIAASARSAHMIEALLLSRSSGMTVLDVRDRERSPVAPARRAKLTRELRIGELKENADGRG